MSEYQDIIDKLPHHLQQYVVAQNYHEYTSIDHAVWRYVMRINYNFLHKIAHPSYIEGLKETGISIEQIPNILDMNKALAKIGWSAVCVDGFIPPSTFMEFQAYNVLVIAADIRQLKHIEYTPAPDIIHEAAGHSPIISDPEYAEYLRLFGEIGSKAISSAEDYALYEAIRHLSIAKEDRASTEEDIKQAEIDLGIAVENVSELSEMAKIRNLHWWTVEYGLFGDLDKPQIYGAGLLSSIGESKSCLRGTVEKIPYSIKAATCNFDITKQQPQLFVTPNFSHLIHVLNEFADNMALRKGGTSGVEKAIKSQNVATCVYDSGLQVSGLFTKLLQDKNQQVIYVGTTGPTILCQHNKVLTGHGKDYHAHGFSSPVGKIKNIKGNLLYFSIDELREQGISVGSEVVLDFESGVKVSGVLRIVRKDFQNQNLLLSFENCTVGYKSEVLFEPSWGIYDMAIGTQIASVFSGPADPIAYEKEAKVAKEKTPKPVYDTRTKKLQKLYGRVRAIREGKKDIKELQAIFDTVRTQYPERSLIILEIYEITMKYNSLVDLRDKALLALNKKMSENERLHQLVSDGLALCEMHS